MRQVLEGGARAVARHGQELGVVYGLMFGSAILGRLRRDSDIDVAVKLSGQVGVKRLLRVMAVLGSAVAKETGIEDVDVIVLNTVSNTMRFEVFSRGRPIYWVNHKEYIADKVKVIDEYLDFLPAVERRYKMLLERIRGW